MLENALAVDSVELLDVKLLRGLSLRTLK